MRVPSLPSAVAPAVEEAAPGDDVLALDSIVLDGTATNSAEAIAEAGQLLVAAGAVEPSYVDAMHERETVGVHLHG